MNQKKVTIYSTPTCHFCHMAKDYFKEHGVAFEDYNVAMDRERAMEMMQKTGQSGVPVIVVGDDIVVGFNQPVLADLLGIK